MAMEKITLLSQANARGLTLKKNVNFIIRTVEFINYSRRSAVKSLHNYVILYNAEMGRLVQNYRIKFTSKQASSFGTWWEVGGDDRGERKDATRDLQGTEMHTVPKWLVSLYVFEDKTDACACIVTCCDTYLLTLWSRVLLEKLASMQLVKKFPAFYGTRRFLTALTNARQLSLS